MGIFNLRRPNVVEMERKKDVEGLIKALQYKKDQEIRKKAAWALVWIKDKRAVEALIRALRDENKDIRREVLYALSQRMENIISGYISRAFDWNMIGDVEDLIRVGGIPTKEDISKAGNKLLTAASPEIQQLQIEHKKFVEPLVDLLKDKDKDIRSEAARVLRMIKDDRAVEALTHALKDEDKDVQKAAKEALEKIKARKS